MGEIVLAPLVVAMALLALCELTSVLLLRSSLWRAAWGRIMAGYAAAQHRKHAPEAPDGR